MMDRMVSFCLRRGWLIVAVFTVVAAYGIYSWRQLAIEAYPDISDTQAQVITQYPGHAAEEMEQQITIPLERELRGIPGLHVMRSKEHLRPFFDHAGLPRWGGGLLGAAAHSGADLECGSASRRGGGFGPAHLRRR